MRGLACGLLLLACWAAPLQAEGEGDTGAIPPPEELEARGSIIGEVKIRVGDVFDTSVEGESAWLYRTANKLHIETRPSVIRDQLLFKPGEPYRHRLVQETERILRANGYLYDAVVVRPLMGVSRWMWKVFDNIIIDGTVNLLANLQRAIGWFGSLFQSGQVNTYAFIFALGVLWILGVMVF